jgi:hypothetical protein
MGLCQEGLNEHRDKFTTAVSQPAVTLLVVARPPEWGSWSTADAGESLGQFEYSRRISVPFGRALQIDGRPLCNLATDKFTHKSIDHLNEDFHMTM